MLLCLNIAKHLISKKSDGNVIQDHNQIDSYNYENCRNIISSSIWVSFYIKVKFFVRAVFRGFYSDIENRLQNDHDKL